MKQLLFTNNNYVYIITASHILKLSRQKRCNGNRCDGWEAGRWRAAGGGRRAAGDGRWAVRQRERAGRTNRFSLLFEYIDAFSIHQHY